MSAIKNTVMVGVCGLLGSAGALSGAVLFQDGFETAWSGDYAAGWENSAYRHGTPPVSLMMQQTAIAHTGSAGMKLVADSTPDSSMFWAGVVVQNLPANAMLKENDPWISASYYDQPSGKGSGQLFAVPSWVNPYIPPGEDWTDVQFGGRRNVKDKFYSVASGENSPGWVDTGVVREEKWYDLKMQLSSADGRIHFYIDGVEVGQTYRNDYVDLGTEVGLFTMFLPTDITSKPFTIWDDVQVGSAVPEPSTYAAGAMLLLPFGASLLRNLRKNRKA